MRGRLDTILTDLAEQDARVRLIVADLGNFREFRRRFPTRFINAGVAEANAAGIAAGMASEGLRVYLYSVAGFVLHRGIEQIRYSIGYWNKPVCLLGTGFGWQYHFIGRGHHAADDIALMRLVPNMRIAFPTDEACLDMLMTQDLTRPLYVRLGSGMTGAYRDLGECGPDTLAVVAPGEMALRCQAAVEECRKTGIPVALRGIWTVEPRHLRDTLGSTQRVLIVEDHVAFGGIRPSVEQAGYEIAGHLHAPVHMGVISPTCEGFATACGLDTPAIARAIRGATTR